MKGLAITISQAADFILNNVRIGVTHKFSKYFHVAYNCKEESKVAFAGVNDEIS